MQSNVRIPSFQFCSIQTRGTRVLRRLQLTGCDLLVGAIRLGNQQRDVQLTPRWTSFLDMLHNLGNSFCHSLRMHMNDPSEAIRNHQYEPIICRPIDPQMDTLPCQGSPNNHFHVPSDALETQMTFLEGIRNQQRAIQLGPDGLLFLASFVQ